MKSKSILLLGLALGCGLVASIGISQVMDHERTPVATGETEPIFVALTDINPNDLVTAQLLKLEEWPRGKAPAGAITKLEDVEGKRCRQKLFAGEPVLAVKLRGAGEDVLPSDNIPKGFRVVNVRVDSVSGTGLIVPGDRVDVLVFLQKNPSAGIPDASARTLLQDIKVYAVDSTFVGKHEADGQLVSGKTVSLLVTPQQAEKVTLASELGSIRLVVRSMNDDQESTSTGASVADIFGSEKNAAALEERPADSSLASMLRAQPLPPAPMPLPQPDLPTPTPPPWKMVVIEGSAMREVAFPGESLPVVEASEGTLSPANLPPAGTPAADGLAPMLPEGAETTAPEDKSSE